MTIHPTAIVDASAQVHESASVGPYCIVGASSIIGEDCELRAHVVVGDHTTLGKRNVVYQFATVGEQTPDKKFKGEVTTCTIGDDNLLREGVTIHRGTVQDRSDTSIGSRNLLMPYVHIAHDCELGNDIVMANNASLAGHVCIDDFAILSGYSMVHQFCHVGAYSFLGAAALVLKDVPAYVMVGGNPSAAHGLNSVGLRRNGFSAEVIREIKSAYRTVFRENHTLSEAVEQLSLSSTPELVVFVNSLKRAKRGIVR